VIPLKPFPPQGWNVGFYNIFSYYFFLSSSSIFLLNSKNRILDIVEITQGTVNQANPIIREIFEKALQSYASSIICVHNHPSGDPKPSKEDEEFTKSLTKAGEILNIKVLDHIIIGDDEYYSFADEGMM